jgi:hypothetical protein
MLWLLGAWVSLPVPATPPLSRRAIVMAVLATGAMLLSFMPRPLELEGFEVTELEWVTEDGAPITAELRAALKASVAERLDPGASQR